MDDIRLYDFKKSKKFSLENIRNLTVMCEEFCKLIMKLKAMI